MDRPIVSTFKPRYVTRRSFVRSALAISAASALTVACSLPRRESGKSDPGSNDGPGVPRAGLTAKPTDGVPLARPAEAPATSRPIPKSPRSGGTLLVALPADAADLDPQLTSSLSRRRVTMLTYNNLVRLDNDITIKPDLAETWKVSSDGRRIDFKLRQGIRWHPPVSREMTAADVKFSYERLLKESPGKADFSAIEGIEVVDKYNLGFILREAQAGLLASMADSRWGAIVNRETVEKNGDLRRTAVGTGPFILEDWRVELEMRLRRNPDYHEKGKPYLDGLVLKILRDEANVVAGLRAGAIHHATLEQNTNHEQLKDAKNLTAYRAPRLGYDFMNFNQKVEPFNRPEVVQAMSWAIDREECISTAASGYAVQTPPCTPPMKQWQLDKTRWAPFYKPDLDRARKLLARAGLPNGFEATALIIPTIPTMLANARVVQAAVWRIGVDLRVESVEYSVWIRRWQAKDFQCTLNTTSGYADPDAAFFRAFHSKAQNWNNIDNPELDRLLEQGRAVTEVEKRRQIYDQVQMTLLERPGHLFLFSAEMIDFTQKFVMGFSQHPTATLWSYADVWLDQ